MTMCALSRVGERVAQASSRVHHGNAEVIFRRFSHCYVSSVPMMELHRFSTQLVIVQHLSESLRMWRQNVVAVGAGMALWIIDDHGRMTRIRAHVGTFAFPCD